MSKAKTFDWIVNESKIPFLKLDIDIPTEEILNEILTVQENATAQSGNASWKGSLLHGIAADKPRPAKFYGYENEDEAPYKWTRIAEETPFTKNWIESTFPYSKLYRTKINLLEAGGEIGPHVDAKKHILGVSDLTSPEHVTYVTLAIKWPKEVIFNVGSHRMPIFTGEAYLINFSCLHEVYNWTNEDRYSIILMANLKDNKEWHKLIENSYEKYGEDYKRNKSDLSFLLKSRLYYRPKYLLSRLKYKLIK